MLPMCFSTALAESASRRAMAGLEWPSAIRASSCRSRSVKFQRIVASLYGQPLGDDLGADHRRAAGHPVQGVGAADVQGHGPQLPDRRELRTQGGRPGAQSGMTGGGGISSI
jgi:hypothetical protein